MKTTERLTIEVIPLSEKLRAAIKREIDHCEEELNSERIKRPSLPPLLGKIGGMIVFFGGISYLISLVNRKAALIVLILLGFGVIQGLGIALGLLPREDFKVRRYLKSIVRRNESLLNDNRIVSIRCKPLAVILVEHHERKDVHHQIFDVGESTLLYFGCCDREYRQLFSSRDFELLGYVDSHIIWTSAFDISGLEPVRVIEQEASRRFRIPDGIMFTFQGTLDSVEEDLRSRLPLRRSDETLWYC